MENSKLDAEDFELPISLNRLIQAQKADPSLEKCFCAVSDPEEVTKWPILQNKVF